jgi:hypothetical protein
VEQVIDYDATIIERLRAAGAVLLAKLSLGAIAQGDQWFGGQTKTPWNPQAGSSGSSAGPGSATAAGCVAFAIGTETRGSILSPTSVNGLAGLRPTYGRVSRYGAMALSTTMDKIGPMCRYVEDTMLVLNAIYGPDKHDGSVADAALKWNPDQPLAGMRIAYVKSAFDAVGQAGRGGAAGAAGGRAAAAAAGTAPATAAPVPAAAPAAGAPATGAAAAGRGRGLTPEQQTARNAELRKIADDVLATYQKLGAKLEPVELPDGLLAAAQPLNFILEVEAAASFDDITRSGDVNLLSSGASRSSWPNTFRQGRLVPAVEYIRAMRARTILMLTGVTAWHAWHGTVPQAFTMGAVGTAALLANAISFTLLWAFRQGDSNMRSAWICTRNDVHGNLAVLPLTDRLQALFAGRVSGLPAATRELLLLAVLAGSADYALLDRVTGGQLLGHLAPAERAGLVHADDSTRQLVFRHPLTRSAVVGMSTAQERSMAHRLLADALR